MRRVYARSYNEDTWSWIIKTQTGLWFDPIKNWFELQMFLIPFISPPQCKFDCRTTMRTSALFLFVWLTFEMLISFCIRNDKNASQQTLYCCRWCRIFRGVARVSSPICWGDWRGLFICCIVPVRCYWPVAHVNVCVSNVTCYWAPTECVNRFKRIIAVGLRCQGSIKAVSHAYKLRSAPFFFQLSCWNMTILMLIENCLFSNLLQRTTIQPLSCLGTVCCGIDFQSAQRSSQFAPVWSNGVSLAYKSAKDEVRPSGEFLD